MESRRAGQLEHCPKTGSGSHTPALRLRPGQRSAELSGEAFVMEAAVPEKLHVLLTTPLRNRPLGLLGTKN